MNNINVKKWQQEYSGAFIIHYADAFQRREVWDSACGNAFLESLTRGWVPLSTIVLAPIHKCLKAAKKNGNEADVKYFQDLLDRGFECISLDGQNRSKYLEKFMKNEVTVTGDLTDADGYTITVKNKFFKDLPVRLQDNIKISSISVANVVTGSQKELSEIFRNLNSGVPLNSHEKRHSYPTPIANEVRRLSEKYNSVMRKLVDEKNISRMFDDELIAKMMMVLMPSSCPRNTGWGLSSAEIDEFYTIGNSFHQLADPGSPYDRRSMARAIAVLENWSHVIQKQKVYYGKQRVAAKMAWASLYACEWAYNNGYLISDHKEFFEILKGIDDKLSSRSEDDYDRARQDAIKQGLDPQTTVLKSGYYLNWQNLPHQTPARNRRIAELVAEIQSHTFKLGLRLRPATKTPKPVKNNDFLVQV